jgi:hypothetical protein
MRDQASRGKRKGNSYGDACQRKHDRFAQSQLQIASTLRSHRHAIQSRGLTA